jgi:C-terminal processing protease CtpA/Prc
VWSKILAQADRPYQLKTTQDTTGSAMGGSDQQSFVIKNIPVLFFFTGVHADYHKPSDTWDKINAEGAAKVAKLAADTAVRVSWLKDRPQFVKVKETTTVSGGGGFRVRLGTVPDYSAEVEGVRLEDVRPGSPAEKGGLKPGDILVEFDGKSIRSVQEYSAVLGTAQPNVPVKIVVLRGGKRVELTVTPAPGGG